jgi:hypothetical protein
LSNDAPQTPQPFWEDDVAPESLPLDSRQRLTSQALNFIGILLTLPVLLVPALLLAIYSPLGAWLWVIWVLLITALRYFRVQQRKRLVAQIAEIQARAKTLTGATQIGSAIHVAGHPLLTRDQPIVLALRGNVLSVYGYHNPVLLDSVPIAQLLSIQTVTYDDQRIPHVEVIDSAAQALQLAFIRDGETWTYLLRRMLKVRPIDWYHAIQQARFSISRAGNSG